MGLTIEIQAIFELFFRQFLDVGKRKTKATHSVIITINIF